MDPAAPIRPLRQNALSRSFNLANLIRTTLPRQPEAESCEISWKFRRKKAMTGPARRAMALANPEGRRKGGSNQPPLHHSAASRFNGRWTRDSPIEPEADHEDRKSTRLNSSHPSISYAVFCLK